MALEASSKASLDIMGFSLCVDDNSLLGASILKNDNNLMTDSIETIPEANEDSKQLFVSNSNNFSSLNYSVINSEVSYKNSDQDDSILQLDHTSIQRLNPYFDTDHNKREINLNQGRVKSDNAKIKQQQQQQQPFSVIEQTNSASGSKNTELNTTEIDSVKHKISSLWNNVKYGWTSYLKKGNKIDLDSSDSVYVVGKQYVQNEMKIKHNSNISPMNSLNDSYINTSMLNYDDYADSQHSLNLLNNADYMPFESSNFISLPSQNQSSLNSGREKCQERNASELCLDVALINKNMETPLQRELYSRLWFTYRKDFEPIVGTTKYTTDCGWGCMLRSAQMLIAQGLLVNFFGHDWSLFKSLKTASNCNLYKEIVSLFNDRSKCPFGLHRLLEIADHKSSGSKSTSTNKVNSRVGTWFGPTSVCLLMKDALNEAIDSSNVLLNKVRIYVAQDCTVYKQDVYSLCCANTNAGTTTMRCTANEAQNFDSSNSNANSSDGKVFIPCILLISVRLGGEKLNDIYVDSLKMFLRMENCIGLIGGKPKHSLYFVGYQGEKIIYLDPHLCQPTVNVFSPLRETHFNIKKSLDNSLILSSYVSNHQAANNVDLNWTMSSIDFESFDNTSYHCAHPNKMSFTKLDPSLAIGFFCKTLSDFDSFCDNMKKAADTYDPIFGVCDDSFERVQQNYQSVAIDDKQFSHKNSQLSPESSLKKTKTTSVSSKSHHNTHYRYSAANNNLFHGNNPRSPNSINCNSKLNSKNTDTDTAKHTSNSETSNLSSSKAFVKLNNKTNLFQKSSNSKHVDPDDFVLV